jgi:hypothetical protein
MTLPATLLNFVDAELARMPVLIDQVCRQTVDALRRPAAQVPSASERMLRFDIAQVLELHARRFCDAFVSALEQRLKGDFVPADAATHPAPRRGLALLDEAAHSADIEIARCAALIASAAEWELRELQTFTSALRGLPYVSVTSNPLRPEVFAHALWQAADTLSAARTSPLLLHAAGGPLAEALRRALAGACTRLEAQGVQPSLYRTAVPTQGQRASVLTDLLESVPAKAGAEPGAPLAAAAHTATAELLKGLFDSIAHSSQMHPALSALTVLLRTTALELAGRDRRLLDDTRHPLWRLLDRLAYQSATHPNPADPQLLAWVAFAAERVASLQASPPPDAQRCRSAVEQLDAYAAAQFAIQLQQAGADIASLHGGDPGPATLVIASLDTVPANLLADALPPEADPASAAWLEQQQPGSWYRMFLRGRWTVMRLLWRSEARSHWLFAGAYPQRNDAFDRAAMVRLRAEALIRPLVERAVVARAAESLRRRLADPRKSG